MIFVTVGTQLAFDRLVNAVDFWSKDHLDVKVFAQIGPSTEKTQYIDSADFLSPAEANKYFKAADLIVAHAGMGSILTALQLNKPILIMPRKASLGEHRNEHQLATAKWLEGKPGIYVANDENVLVDLLNRLSDLSCPERIADVAPKAFSSRINQFILG